MFDQQTSESVVLKSKATLDIGFPSESNADAVAKAASGDVPTLIEVRQDAAYLVP